MSELAKLNSGFSEDNDLPEACMSYARYQFYPRGSKWKLVDGCKSIGFKFDYLSGVVSEDVLKAFKLVMIEYVQTRSLSHVINCFRNFKSFVSLTASQKDAGALISSIRAVDLLNFLAHLRSKSTADAEYWLGVLSGFLRRWHNLGYTGIDADAYVLLSELRLKGNPKGQAVLTMDPYKGPFSTLELQSISDELHHAFARGEISVKSFVLVWLFIATAARAIQLSLLKIRDLKIATSSDGSSCYIISIPCAKERGRRHRERFIDRPLIPELGKVIEVLIEEVKRDSQFDPLDPSILDEPLFPAWNADAPIGFDNHQTSQALLAELSEIMSSLPTSSERTGQRIGATSRRFRYTLATRAAREGHGPLVIAALLGHVDTLNVQVYTQTTPECIERIDKATAIRLAPLAQAFAGMIVTDETAAERGDDPTSRISDPRLGCGSGTCGKYGFCSALAPIACYTCRKFQPWLDGPHEKMLDSLIAERERILELTGDQNVASVHDRTILAVAEVIRRCRLINEESENE